MLNSENRNAQQNDTDSVFHLQVRWVTLSVGVAAKILTLLVGAQIGAT